MTREHYKLMYWKVKASLRSTFTLEEFIEFCLAWDEVTRNLRK